MKARHTAIGRPVGTALAARAAAAMGLALSACSAVLGLDGMQGRLEEDARSGSHVGGRNDSRDAAEDGQVNAGGREWTGDSGSAGTHAMGSGGEVQSGGAEPPDASAGGGDPAGDPRGGGGAPGALGGGANASPGAGSSPLGGGADASAGAGSNPAGPEGGLAPDGAADAEGVSGHGGMGGARAAAGGSTGRGGGAGGQAGTSQAGTGGAATKPPDPRTQEPGAPDTSLPFACSSADVAGWDATTYCHIMNNGYDKSGNPQADVGDTTLWIYWSRDAVSGWICVDDDQANGRGLNYRVLAHKTGTSTDVPSSSFIAAGDSFVELSSGEAPSNACTWSKFSGSITEGIDLIVVEWEDRWVSSGGVATTHYDGRQTAESPFH